MGKILRTKHDLDAQQVRAIKRWLEEKQIALFGDLGTGKTIVSLYVAKYLLQKKLIRNALVVSTIRCVYSTWMQEAAEWKYTCDLKFNILHGPEKRGRFTNFDADIHLLNWEGMPWLGDLLRAQAKNLGAFPYDMLVLDESTKIKDHRTQRFKKWKLLAREFEYRGLLTATPKPQSDMDLWSQFFMLDDGESLDTSYVRFRDKYFESFVPHIWQPKPGAPEQIWNKIAPKVVRLIDSREKKEAEHTKIRVELGDKLMQQYRKFEHEYFIQLESGEVEVFNAISLAIKLRQFVQGGMYSPKDDNGDQKIHIVHWKKIEALEELIELHPDTNFLCPIQFRFEINMLRQRFGKDLPILAGKAKQLNEGNYKDPDAIIAAWNRQEIPLLPCHPITMSHGLNLQKGGHMICWLGLTWSLEQYDQLIGRLDRRGQEHDVKIFHLVANDTTDEAVLDALHKKATGQKDFLNHLREYWENKKDD